MNVQLELVLLRLYCSITQMKVSPGQCRFPGLLGKVPQPQEPAGWQHIISSKRRMIPSPAPLFHSSGSPFCYSPDVGSIQLDRNGFSSKVHPSMTAPDAGFGDTWASADAHRPQQRSYCGSNRAPPSCGELAACHSSWGACEPPGLKQQQRRQEQLQHSYPSPQSPYGLSPTAVEQSSRVQSKFQGDFQQQHQQHLAGASASAIRSGPGAPPSALVYQGLGSSGAFDTTDQRHYQGQLQQQQEKPEQEPGTAALAAASAKAFTQHQQHTKVCSSTHFLQNEGGSAGTPYGASVATTLCTKTQSPVFQDDR